MIMIIMGWGVTQGDPPGLQLGVHLASLHRDEHHPNTDHDQHSKSAHKGDRHHVAKPHCTKAQHTVDIDR